MAPSFRFGPFELRPQQRLLLRDGCAVPLGGRSFDLLLALMQRRDRVIAARELLEVIWPRQVVEENNLRQQVAALRRVLGNDAIVTVPGRGYRFGLPVEENGSAAGPVARPGIAVLPFANLSADAAQEYFADALTQEIITALCRHRWLIVIARNTVFGYKNAATDTRRLASELGIQYLVVGTVQRSGNDLRVTAQLVDATNGSTCWSEHYDRQVEQVFELQDEIAQMIVGSLEPEIGYAERRKLPRASATSLQAWERYHLGISHFFRFTATDNREAIRLLQSSREMEPTFGEAHAWWAYALVLDMVYWSAPADPETLQCALEAAQEALRLDDSNAVLYVMKARVQLARGEYDSARAENRVAIELNPTLASAYCGLADTLAYQGHYDEALESFRKALALSPRDPQRWAFLTYGALAMIFKGDYALAAEWTRQAREIPNCQYWATAHQAVAYACAGNQTLARQSVAELLQLQPDFSLRFARAKMFYVKDETQLARYMAGLSEAGVPD